jgi:mannose-6-phosphate isomerase-like protein (cupin superfamily)
MIVRENEVESFDFDGLKIQDYTATSDGQSSFAVISVLPLTSHRLSWSKRSDKYYYMIAGEIHFIVDGKALDLSKGDLCVIKKGEKFSYQNTSKENARMILIHTPSFQLDQEVFE